MEDSLFNFFVTVNRQNAWLSKKIILAHKMASFQYGIYMPKQPHDAVKVGMRLERIRIALNLGNQTEFAKALGVERARYHNWISGVALFPVQYAAKLKDMTGVTLDYIYCEDGSSLPLRVARELGLTGSAE